jgi:hypothetical protein
LRRRATLVAGVDRAGQLVSVEKLAGAPGGAGSQNCIGRCTPVAIFFVCWRRRCWQLGLAATNGATKNHFGGERTVRAQISVRQARRRLHGFVKQHTTTERVAFLVATTSDASQNCWRWHF